MEFQLFAAMMFLGWIATEGAVEYFIGALLNFFNVDPKYNKLLIYPSALVGVFFAWHYGLDIPAAWLGMKHSFVGVAATGFVVGRGANAVHEAAQLIAGWVKTRF